MGKVQSNTTQMRIHTASRNTLAAWNAIKIRNDKIKEL